MQHVVTILILMCTGTRRIGILTGIFRPSCPVHVSYLNNLTTNIAHTLQIEGNVFKVQNSK